MFGAGYGNNVMYKENKESTIWGVALSVLAAAFGVQSDRNRERDFKYGKAENFIIMGLIITVLFVLGIWGVVSMVLE